MTEAVKDDLYAKVALVLLTLILTSLGQSAITALRSNPIEELSRRVFAIETVLATTLPAIQSDLADIKRQQAQGQE